MEEGVLIHTIEQLRARFTLQQLCFLLGIARSTYYRWKKKNHVVDAVTQAVIDLCTAHKFRLGYRKVTHRVSKMLNQRVNHKRVLRLMRIHQLCCRSKRKRKSFLSGQDSVIAPNLIQRHFKAMRPNEKWFTDITYLNFGKETLYLSSILDTYNNEIVSYKISNRPDIPLVLETLEEACRKRKVSGTVLHSDQGGTYTSGQFQRLVKEKGITMSMSRKGNCHDNAVIESFHSVLKSEAFYAECIEYVPTSTVHQIVEEYIYYYNHHRFQQKLNYLSPIEFWQQVA